MAFVMTKDGKVRPAQVSDLKEVAERDERIKQLEQQCATLAAEVDRMRPVVEATQRWRHGWERRKLSQAYQMIVAMAKTVDAYEAAKEQDAKVRS